jgi:hypothetical protein
MTSTPPDFYKSLGEIEQTSSSGKAKRNDTSKNRKIS